MINIDNIKKSFLFEITTSNICNMSCTYCVNHCEDKSKDPLILTKNQIDKMIDLFKTFVKKDKNYMLVAKIYGGEPLIFPHLFYLLDRLYEVMIEYELDNKNLYIPLITNGYALDTDMINKLKPYFEKLNHTLALSMSLDGNKENHDLHRVNNNHLPTFDTIYNNLNNFCSNISNMATAQAVLTPNLMKESEKLFEFLNIFEQDSKNLKLRRNFILLNTNDTSFGKFTRQEIDYLFNTFETYLFQNLHLLTNKTLLPFKFEKIMEASTIFTYDFPRTTYCPAGSSKIGIAPNGDLYPCVNLFFNGLTSFSYGNMYDPQSLQNFYDKQDYWRKITSAKIQCGKCQYGNEHRPSCLGGCVATNMANTKTFTTPWYTCYCHKKYSDIAFKLYKKIPEVFNKVKALKE